MKKLKNFVSKNKKGLAALLVAIGTAFTPVPSIILNVTAPLIVNGAESALDNG